jgi:hypothetical protein
MENLLHAVIVNLTSPLDAFTVINLIAATTNAFNGACSHADPRTTATTPSLASCCWRRSPAMPAASRATSS